MQPIKRRELIVKELSKREDIDVEELANHLQVSSMTIRRDLKVLENESKVIRTHGGAVLKQTLINESAFKDKETKNNDLKQMIAEEAIQLVQENSTLLLDSGTTTLEIAKRLKNKHNITVITNDIHIAAELMDSHLSVVLTGGNLQNDTGALSGAITEDFIRATHVDLCFLGAHAVDVRAGITAPTHDKAYVKKRMIEAAERTWLVADSSKVHERSFTKVCSLTDLNGMIVDNQLSDEDLKTLAEQVKVKRIDEEGSM